MRRRPLLPLLILLAGCGSPARSRVGDAAVPADAAAEPAVLAALPVQRVGDRGFVLLPEAPVLPEGLTWTKLEELDVFFSGTFTTLEIAVSPPLARARTFSLPGVHDERELVTAAAVFLRVRREAWNPEVAPTSIGVERVVVALEIDLTGVAARAAPFVLTGSAAGWRRIEREALQDDPSERVVLDAWLAAEGYPRAGEAVMRARFTGTDLEELQSGVAGDRLLVWRRGGSSLGALRMPMSETAWGHLVAAPGEQLLVIEHGTGSVSGTGLDRWLTLRPVPAS